LKKVEIFSVIVGICFVEAFLSAKNGEGSNLAPFSVVFFDILKLADEVVV